MALPVWRTEGLLSDRALLAYLHGLKGYRPGPAPRISTTGAGLGRPITIITVERLRDRIISSLPLEDLLAWLLESFSGYPLHEILKATGGCYVSRM